MLNISRYWTANLLFKTLIICTFLWWLGGKEWAWQCRSCGFNPWVGKIPWRWKWQATPVFLPGKSQGQWLQSMGSQKSDTTYWLNTNNKQAIMRVLLSACLPVPNISLRTILVSLVGERVSCLNVCFLDWVVKHASICYYQVVFPPLSCPCPLPMHLFLFSQHFLYLFSFLLSSPAPHPPIWVSSYLFVWDLYIFRQYSFYSNLLKRYFLILLFECCSGYILDAFSTSFTVGFVEWKFLIFM